MDAFLSYSRRDDGFVRGLHTFLISAGFDVWIDWKDVPPASPWQRDVYDAIDAAATFIVVISANSLTSDDCLAELRHAEHRGKRIIPVACESVDPRSAPLALRQLNWICLTTDDGDDEFAKVAQAIEIDLEWARAHSRLLVRSGEWESSDNDTSLLLRGRTLRTVEELVVANAGRRPPLTDVQQRYLHASRRSVARRHRFALGSAVLALGTSTALGGLALLQRQTARREESTAASVALAASGNERLSSRPAQALLLGVAGFDESPTAAARSTAIKALQRVRSLGVWEILHSGAKVTALGFGRRSLGVGYADGTVRQWDVRARNELRVLRIPGGSPIVGVSSASKTEIVVAASKTGHLRVWNARNGHPIRDLTAPGAIVAIGVSDDGRLIAAFGGGDRVWLWDTRTRRRLSLAAPRGSTANVAFSARGRILAVSVTKINYPESDESTVRVWNTETGARMWTLPTVDIVDAVAFDATGKLVTAGFYPATRYDPEDAYGEVAVWDVQRRVRSRIRTNKGADRWIGFTRGGRTLLVSVGQAVRTAAPSRSAWLGTRIAMLGNYPDWFAVSSDGHFLATAAAGETDVEIRNLRVRHLLGRVVRAQRNSILLGGSTNDMGQLAATGYGIGRGSRVFFVAAHDRAVSVASWLATPSPSHVAFSGDVLAVQSDDGSVDVWSVASRTRIASLPPDSGELLGLGNNVLTFDASHRLLAEGVRTAIRVLDIRKQRLVGPPIKIHDAVAAGFTHDGRTLRTVSNGFLESWDVIRGRRIGPRIALLTLPQPAHVIPPVMAAFDSTGDLVAVAPSASQDMFIWDARKRVPVAEFPRASYSELASAFSPDSRTVAVPGSDLYRNRIRGRVQLWDVRSGTPLGGPLYAAGYMRAVAFSAHGRILVTISDSDDSGSANGSDVHFWPLEWLADLRREACRVVIGGLTEDEWRTIVPELRYRKSC